MYSVNVLVCKRYLSAFRISRTEAIWTSCIILFLKHQQNVHFLEQFYKKSYLQNSNMTPTQLKKKLLAAH